MKKICAALLLGLALLAGACTGEKVARRADDNTPNRITQQEIQDAATALSAYALVRRLHPQWLHKRGSHSITSDSYIHVYLDGIDLGGTRSLRSIDLTTVQSIEFLPPAEANLRFGVGNDHGAILVHTKGGG